MKQSEQLRPQVYQLMEEQLASGTPPEVLQTYHRLVQLGLTHQQAREQIYRCLLLEVNHSLNNKHIFNEKRYLRNLCKLTPYISD